MCAGLVTFLRSDEQARRHLTAGRALGALRRALQHLRDIDLAVTHSPVDRARLDELAKAKADADDQAPAVSDWAIRRVEKRLKGGDFTQEQKWA